MDKKDIYDHLAKIYLDASSETAKKSRKGLPFPITNILLVVIVAAGASFLLFSHFRAANLSDERGRTALVLLPDAAKINFNFNPAKKETYTIDLNRLNLNRFNAVAFALKKSNLHNSISVRVEFTNAFNETAEVYVKNIPYRWHDYRLDLSEFKRITDWVGMRSLSFTVEQWNTSDDNGVVYIDNVRLLR